jgi:CRP-like cAMP-binding protein
MADMSGHSSPTDPVSHIASSDAMLSLIEKVELLTHVAFFQRIPTHILAAVAERCEEHTFAEGQAILRSGDVGDYLYVVADGSVRVSTQLAQFDLGKGEVVGELAVLDPGLRNADVFALSNVVVLQLASNVVDELLLDHPEVSRSIIAGLVRRLRLAVDPSRQQTVSASAHPGHF